LISLASTVPRKLQLITRGGYPYLSDLRRVFSEVVFVDTTSFMKTVYRQRLTFGIKNEVRWVDSKTGDFEPLDELLEHNLNSYRSVILDGAHASNGGEYKERN
jgi:hypothetical protein